MINDLFQITSPKFEYALCAESDTPDLWFPDSREDRKVKVPQAKKLCNDCLHRFECLEFALEHDIREGVWGGKSERERELLKPRSKNRNKDNQAGARGFRLRQQGKSIEQIGFILNMAPHSVSNAISKYVNKITEEESE